MYNILATIVMGGFNSHDLIWGHNDSNKNGKDLITYRMMAFHSARWNRYYNPDLYSVSKDE